MISETDRREILRLHQRGWGSRRIARLLGRVRSTVQRIVKEGTPEPPTIERQLKLEPHLDKIRELYVTCERNLVRVAEELEKAIGTPVVYSTLTKFCRAHELGQPASWKEPSGTYEFGPGVEAQHDTSPMKIVVGGKARVYQATSYKFGYSRARYLQFYRKFRRLHCQHFITQSFVFFEGLCERVVIDNTSVVIAHGTGSNAVPVPKMADFAKRYGFRWLAHEKGDANRKAKVERDFRFVRTNFLKGRTFTDDDDLNRQALEWCRAKNATPDRRRGVSPDDQLAIERPHLIALPRFIAPVYKLHPCRRVDVRGCVSLDGNLYSAPKEWIGREVSVRETLETVTLLDGPRELCQHKRIPEGERAESRLPEHKRSRRVPRRAGSTTIGEEAWLTAQSPILGKYVTGLKEHTGRRYPYQIRRLYGLCRDYGVEAVQTQVERSMTYDLYDVERLEKMLLQELGTKLFSFCDQKVDLPSSGRITPVPDPDTDEERLTKTDEKDDDPAKGDPDGDE